VRFVTIYKLLKSLVSKINVESLTILRHVKISGYLYIVLHHLEVMLS